MLLNRVRPKMRPAVIVVVGLALLGTGCIRFTYDETPTALPEEAAAPTSSPAATEPAPTAEPTSPAAEGPPVLRIEPPLVDMPVGQTREVQVQVDNAVDLHSIRLHISFEPRYVTVEDADPATGGIQIAPGPLLPSVQVTQNDVNCNAGLIVYQAQAGEGAGRGSGPVASFTVRSLAEGGSPLRFNVVELKDPAGEPIMAEEQINGLVVVGAGEDPGEPAEGPSPTAPPPAPTQPATAEGVYHTVQAGENLFRIAQRYDTTVEAIARANGITDPTAVRVGQRLLIPEGQAASGNTYVVQPGDTLYSIARRFGMSVEALAALNGIAPPYTIEVGQTLRVDP